MLGEAHDGSLRAENILYEHRSEALEAFSIIILVATLGSSQQRYEKAFKRARFAFDTCPRTETSMEKRKALKFPDRSARRGEYLSSLKV